jgi:uncharacterized Zn finger protein (UPF0148 family)
MPALATSADPQAETKTIQVMRCKGCKSTHFAMLHDGTVACWICHGRMAGCQWVAVGSVQ